MTRAVFVVVLLIAQSFIAFVVPAHAGGGMTAADVPSPHAAMTAAAAPPAPAGSAGTDGCLPYEARNRAIPPRPRISASALITRSTP